MKFSHICAVLFIFCVTSLAAKDLFLIDQIETIIFGPQDTTIITKSDLEKQGLDGQPRTKDKLVLEHLVFQDGKKFNVVDDKMVDRYIEAVQRENNLSLDDLKDMFRVSGYDYEEGREQLAILQTVNSVIDFKVRSRVVIPDHEIKQYYDANPIYTPESYCLKRMVVPFAEDVLKGKQKNKIIQQLKIEKTVADHEWSEPFWVNVDDLAEDKRFIANLKVDAGSAVNEIEGGFEIFRLVEKREKRRLSLDEQYQLIVNNLRQPLFESLMDEYQKVLFEESTIVHLG